MASHSRVKQPLQKISVFENVKAAVQKQSDSRLHRPYHGLPSKAKMLVRERSLYSLLSIQHHSHERRGMNVNELN